jgi:hypothetical protein
MLKKTFAIFTSRSLLLSIAFVLSACSGQGPSDSSRATSGPDGEYIGWHCQGEIESTDNWNCSEQRLKGGALVAPAQVETETFEPNLLEVNSSEIKGSEINGSEINSSEPAEIILDTSVPGTELTAGEALEQQIPIEQASLFDISAKGFTVQLGAYLSQEMAEQAADNIILTKGELRVRDIVDGERFLFVLVYGQYPLRQQAEIATEQLVELNPELNFWIRTIGSMRERD